MTYFVNLISFFLNSSEISLKIPAYIPAVVHYLLDYSWCLDYFSFQTNSEGLQILLLVNQRNLHKQFSYSHVRLVESYNSCGDKENKKENGRPNK